MAHAAHAAAACVVVAAAAVFVALRWGLPNFLSLCFLCLHRLLHKFIPSLLSRHDLRLVFHCLLEAFVARIRMSLSRGPTQDRQASWTLGRVAMLLKVLS